MSNKEKSVFSVIIDDIKCYMQLKAEYYTLSFTEKISLFVAKIILIGFIATFCFSIFLLLICLGYSLLMSWIGVSWIVLLIEIGFVLLLLIILFLFREKLVIKPVAGMLIRIMLNSKELTKEEKEDKYDE